MNKLIGLEVYWGGAEGEETRKIFIKALWFLNVFTALCYQAN